MSLTQVLVNLVASLAVAIGSAIFTFCLLKARFHQRGLCPICGYADRIRQLERHLASDQDQGPTRRSP